MSVVLKTTITENLITEYEQTDVFVDKMTECRKPY